MYESGYGSSYIAVVGNNHFGIKSYRDWDGPTISCDDDQAKEPFCLFSSVAESYEHHSKFLKNSTRYESLFKLSTKDYKGWAKGLQKCGYATNPKYPSKLIEIIERYGLDRYDKGEKVETPAVSTTSGINKQATTTYASTRKRTTHHKLYSTAEKNGLKYVRANKSDYLVIISREFKIPERKLRQYNDMSKDYRLKEGEIVYLEAKHASADKEHTQHVVQKGESLHSISQKYGVTVASIVKRNNLPSVTIQVGQTLKLR